MTDTSDAFLALATPERHARVNDWVQHARSWEDLRDAFLTVMDEYGAALCALPDEWNIESHEAGGAWHPLYA